ncbi:MAG: uroporphyrinogen-III C-methyltransferase [Planctomycetota bacterium]|nr:uroporphyrinogen-III C-methyltransferase [Planctomycetota bacterium]
MSGQTNDSIGKVYLVGAGPGDPNMLTLRGKECLERADIVLHDYLANPVLLNHAKKADCICLGKHGTGRLISQEEINRQIVEFAKSGKSVVRLKGGDPAIFARSHEELQAIIQHQIPFEIVPGITAALAVTSSVGVPLTHRDVSSAVALVTGQGKEGGPPENIDYRSLAKFPGTLVFYMGTTTVSFWSQELINAGMNPQTPVVAVRHCSLPTQSSFQCFLSNIADRSNQEPTLRPPVLFIVGQTAEQFGKHNWFESRPLFGRSILITRPRHQADELACRFQDLGAEVLFQPAIQINGHPQQDEILRAIGKLPGYDWVIFSSTNGVDYFMQELMAAGDLRALSNCKIAAVGLTTANRLLNYHLKADLVPATFDAESLATELNFQVTGRNVLLVRGNRGRDILNTSLSKTANSVDQLICYQSIDVQQADQQIKQRLSNHQIDYVTVTSSAIANSLVNLLGDQLHKTKLVSISPITSETLRESGFEPAVEAKVYTMEGVVDAVLESTSCR